MSFSKDVIGVQIGKYLLGFCVVGLIFAIGFSQVTEYNTLKPIVTDFAKKLLEGNPGNVPGQTIGKQIMDGITQECKSKEKVEYPFITDKLVLDCKEVQAGGTPVISESVSQLILKDYYKKYDCTPLGCILDIYGGKQGNIAYIYSEQMNSFLKTLIPFLAIGILAGVILIYFSTKDIFLSLDNIGKTLLKSGIPFLFLMILIYRDQLLVSTGILSGNETFMRSTNDFFSGPIYNITNLFLYLYGMVFIVGLICIVSSFVGIKYYKKTNYKKYMADHSSKPQNPLMGDMGIGDMGMGGKGGFDIPTHPTKMREASEKGFTQLQNNPAAWENILKMSLEQEYKDMLPDLEDLPREEKIPKIKERLKQKVKTLNLENQKMQNIHGDVFGKSASELMKANNQKFIGALVGLLNDINNFEKEGKTQEEILKYVRQVMLSSLKVP